MQKDTAPSQPPTVHQHQKPSWPTQQMAILGGKSTAKFDENTVTRVKCPSSLLRGNQQEGPNYSPSQGGGGGGVGRQGKGFIPPEHPNSTFLGKSRNLAFPYLQPLTDSDVSLTREVRFVCT